MKSERLFGILLTAFLLFGCLGGQPPTQASAAPSAAASVAPTQASAVPSAAPSSEQPPAAPGGATDCKTNFDCLIDASKTCAPASGTHTATVDMFGMLITATTFYEIKGTRTGECVLFAESGKQEVRFGDSLRQQMLAAGSTQAEITQAEQQATENAKATEGRTGTCAFASNNDLTALLTKTKAGNAEGGVSCQSTAAGGFDCEATGDWSTAKCECNLFTSETIE